MKLAAALIAIVLLCTAGPSGAVLTTTNFADSPRWGVGLVSNIPKEHIGFVVYSTAPNGVGFYCDLKGSMSVVAQQEDYYENISMADSDGWGDPLSATMEQWASLNLGVTRVLSPTVAGYIGLGLTAESELQERYDPLHILGSGGYYWIDGPSSTSINGVGGLIVAWGRGAGHIGVDAYPFGVTLGISLVY